MKPRQVKLIIVCLLALATAVPVQAQQGDCNNDLVVDLDDAVCLTLYLFQSGPAPNLVKCDCDGFPGVNYGDLWQLVEALAASASLYPSPGTDVPVPTSVKFLVLGQPDGITSTSAAIVVDAPVGADCLLLPFSFASAPGQAVLNCTSVDFTGSVGTNLTAIIDNTGKVFTIHSSGFPSLPSTTNWRLLATANFTQVTPGSRATIKATSTATLFPMLLAQVAYSGVNMVRVLSPVFVPFGIMNVGDVNCDGQVDIDDVVYLINFIFAGGPPPGDPDNDGIPNC